MKVRNGYRDDPTQGMVVFIISGLAGYGKFYTIIEDFPAYEGNDLVLAILFSSLALFGLFRYWLYHYSNDVVEAAVIEKKVEQYSKWWSSYKYYRYWGTFEFIYQGEIYRLQAILDKPKYRKIENCQKIKLKISTYIPKLMLVEGEY